MTFLKLTNSEYVNRKYSKFYQKHGYLPKIFNPYDGKEVKDFAICLTAESNTSPTHSGTLLILQEVHEWKIIVWFLLAA